MIFKVGEKFACRLNPLRNILARFSLKTQFLLYRLQSLATIGENLLSILSKTGNKGGLQLAREILSKTPEKYRKNIGKISL